VRRSRRHHRDPDPEITSSGRPRREFLLGIAREFVAAARELPGVSRIALLGSLMTDKRNPKDVDLLVTIADEMDLGDLARHARRLQGRATSEGVGADVFLCDPRHCYIGRVCIWRECWPRARCDARHCGHREHLHDDLDALMLTADLVRDPPLIVWPSTAARAVVPADVQEALCGPPARPPAR
jgi:predicted nucleotidyltransferase